MKVDDIMPMLESAFQVGFMEAVKTYEPAQDNIRMTELKNWLKIMRIDKKRFYALVENGSIKPFRLGAGRNSPLYFSKQEIKKALTAADIANLFTSQKL